MALRDSTHLLRRLDRYCAASLEAAAVLCQARLHGEITLNHWLLKLIERGDGDIPVILRHYELDVDAIWNALIASIDRLPRDLRGKPALAQSLLDMLERAWAIASSSLAGRTIRSSHILQALVDAPHALHTTDAWQLFTISAVQIQRLTPLLTTRSAEEVEASDTDNKQSTEANAFRPPASATQPASPPVPSSGAPEALGRFAIDLSSKAENGEIDPVHGRDREIQQVIDILVRRRKNNPVLVGEPGVGKTALVEGLALRVADGSVPTALRNIRILTLDLGLLQAGAGVKGEFEQRLKTIIDEVKASPHPILLFIDEAHTLIGAGNAAGGSDAANLLKPALARGEFRTIAATTWTEYKEYFERDAALERRFQLVKVGEPDDAAAALMLRGLTQRYADHHGVHILDEAITAAVRLSRRYIPGRQLPDKAVDLIDTAAARVRMGLDTPPPELQRARGEVTALRLELDGVLNDEAIGHTISGGHIDTLRTALTAAEAEADRLDARYVRERELVETLHRLRTGPADTAAASESSPDAPALPAPATLAEARTALAEVQGKDPMVFVDVDADAVARVVAEWTGVPVGSLLKDEVAGLLTLEDSLAERVMGQHQAIAALAQSLRTAKAGLLRENAPLGVFLLSGPSGVGKTETALALADLLFGGAEALITINMTEYQEAHSVSQLKGSPPGYVGYGRGGVLTEAVRKRPYSVVLLDEVEKAHRDVLEMFYQVFDRGIMRDGEGREIDFSNCVILMTANLGAEAIGDLVAADADSTNAAILEAIHPILSAHFQAALLARFQTIPYRPLDSEALRGIVALKLDKIADRLKRQYGIALRHDPALLSALAEACIEQDSGARNIDMLLNQRILPALASELLARLASETMPATVTLSFSDTDGALAFDFNDSPADPDPQPSEPSEDPALPVPDSVQGG